MLRDFPLIVADESVDGRIIRALRDAGYSVYSIAMECCGIADSEVTNLAIQKQAFIITEDKDFGDELIFRKVSFNTGSLLLRLSGLSIDARIRLVTDVLASNANEMQFAFCVLTSKKLRIRKYLKI